MPGARARRVGRVASDRADKTIIVEVESVRRHRLYKKAGASAPQTNDARSPEHVPHWRSGSDRGIASNEPA